MRESDSCDNREPRPRYLDGIKRLFHEVRESPICEHARGVRREGLLLARSVFDFLVSRLERRPDPEQPLGPDAASDDPVQDAE